MKAQRQAFAATLTAQGPKGAWVHLSVPFSVEAAFGTKARAAVTGTLNGFAFRSSVLPRGDGTHYLAVNKAMQAGAGAQAGDTVQVVLALDLAPRTVAVPADFQAALQGPLAAKFAALAYSTRKEFVDWITSAKQAETRARRVERSLALLRTGGRPKP